MSLAEGSTAQDFHARRAAGREELKRLYANIQLLSNVHGLEGSTPSKYNLRLVEWLSCASVEESARDFLSMDIPEQEEEKLAADDLKEKPVGMSGVWQADKVPEIVFVAHERDGAESPKSSTTIQAEALRTHLNEKLVENLGNAPLVYKASALVDNIHTQRIATSNSNLPSVVQQDAREPDACSQHSTPTDIAAENNMANNMKGTVRTGESDVNMQVDRRASALRMLAAESLAPADAELSSSVKQSGAKRVYAEVKSMKSVDEEQNQTTPFILTDEPETQCSVCGYMSATAESNTTPFDGLRLFVRSADGELHQHVKCLNAKQLTRMRHAWRDLGKSIAIQSFISNFDALHKEDQRRLFRSIKERSNKFM